MLVAHYDGAGVTMMNEQNYQENLPYFINGTLNQEEHADFEQALLNDDVLKKEADFLMALRQQIKDEQVQSPGKMGLHRLKRDIKNESQVQQVDNQPTNKWRLFAIAASLMLVLQTGLQLTQAPTDDIYVPLSGSQQIENVVQIQFKDGVKEQDIRALLIQFNATIIDGPSSVGVYRVKINNLNSSVMQQLQQKTEVIDYIEQE